MISEPLAFKDIHSLRRPGTPEDVTEADLFLASDCTGWITADALDVAGGAVMVYRHPLRCREPMERRVHPQRLYITSDKRRKT